MGLLLSYLVQGHNSCFIKHANMAINAFPQLLPLPNPRPLNQVGRGFMGSLSYADIVPPLRQTSQAGV